jgi:putative ABC transport system permease protein
MFRSLVKTLFRNLRKNKGYSLLNIFGLAMGMACSALIFLWTEHERNFDDNNVKKDRLYAVKVTKTFSGNVFTMGSTPRVMAAALKAEIPGIANTARLSDEPQKLLFSIGDRSLYAQGVYADASLFRMFSFHFLEGDAGNPFPNVSSIVIQRSAAKKFFGQEQNVVGKTVRVNNEQDLVITGVIEDLPQNSTLQCEWLAPYLREDNFWDSYGPFTYVELEPGANLNLVNAQIAHFIEKKQSDQKVESFLFPMSQWRLYNEFANGKPTGGGRIRQVQMLTTIAWIILLIACINFMNLATGSSQQRAKEIGVRKVLGARKTKLVLQFMGETLFMSMVAALIAVGIVALALPAFNALTEKELSMGLLNPTHIPSLLLIALICGLIAGSYPAIYLSSFNPVFVLKGLKLKSGGASFVRKGLVILQFSLSTIFIISTIVVYKQIQHIKNRNLGFDRENLIELDMQHDISRSFPAISQDLLNTGLIQNVASSDHVTIRGGNTDSRFLWPNKPEGADIAIAFRNVSPDYLRTSGMKLIEGRDFSGTENSNVIINRSFAKLMGEGPAIGKTIQSPRGNKEGVFTSLTVIGVVEDYVYGNIYGRPGPVILFCDSRQAAKLIYLRIKPGNAENVLRTIEKLIRKHEPSYPLQYRFVDEQFEAMFMNEVLVGKISGVFASLAILISCLGLFGLAAYTAERRTREIGIRKVLGASVPGLTALLSRNFLQLVFISCIIAFPIAWWLMSEWLQTYEYRIGISPWIFVLACFLAIAIAAITISFHAVKTAITNPIRSLRTE